MPQHASLVPPAIRAGSGVVAETLDWLRRELDRAWADGDASAARLLAHLIGDVQRRADERSPAKTRTLLARYALPAPAPLPGGGPVPEEFASPSC